MKTFILLIGVNGSGKSTIAKLLTEKYPNCLVDSEERAFDRKYLWKIDPDTHASIVTDAQILVEKWKSAPEEIIIVDRWYETYATDCKLPRTSIDEIERSIEEAGFRCYIVNLVIADDYEGMIWRLTHTKNYRNPDWWDPSRGSLEERAKKDLQCQEENRRFWEMSRLHYHEIYTTDMDWEKIVWKIEGILFPEWEKKNLESTET